MYYNGNHVTYNYNHMLLYHMSAISPLCFTTCQSLCFDSPRGGIFESPALYE